MTILQLHTIGL